MKRSMVFVLSLCFFCWITCEAPYWQVLGWAGDCVAQECVKREQILTCAKHDLMVTKTMERVADNKKEALGMYVSDLGVLFPEVRRYCEYAIEECEKECPDERRLYAIAFLCATVQKAISNIFTACGIQYEEL